jgi:DNA-binding response OmpR family regulator
VVAEINRLGRPARVLVVDDERHIARLMEFILKRQGYAVCAAYTGEQALVEARTFLPDVVLLDLMLPGMSGLEVLKELRDGDDGAALKVVVLTARSFEDSSQGMIEAGASCQCTKPIAPSTLIKKLLELGVPPMVPA